MYCTHHFFIKILFILLSYKYYLLGSYNKYIKNVQICMKCAMTCVCTICYWNLTINATTETCCSKVYHLSKVPKSRILWNSKVFSSTKMRWASPWWWRQYARLKCRSTPTRLHGATFQKNLNLIFHYTADSYLFVSQRQVTMLNNQQASQPGVTLSDGSTANSGQACENKLLAGMWEQVSGRHVRTSF
jgi:hypothetical protein